MTDKQIGDYHEMIKNYIDYLKDDNEKIDFGKIVFKPSVLKPREIKNTGRIYGTTFE